jgi:hypothetical protein
VEVAAEIPAISTGQRGKIKKDPEKEVESSTYDAFCSGFGCAERWVKWLLLLLWRFWMLKSGKSSLDLETAFEEGTGKLEWDDDRREADS